MLQDPLLCIAGLLWASEALSRDLETHFGNQSPFHAIGLLLCMMVPSWGQANATRAHFEDEGPYWVPKCEL